MTKAVSVRQLNFYVKSLLDGDKRLCDIYVTGELSNFKNHYSSGHWYFTLKDNDAAVRCVMFRSSAAKVKLEPKDGMQVILRGRATVYEKDGQFQFYAEEMLAVGTGDIAMQFEKIKQKLAAEGLFDPENKRPIVRFPQRIAVVTADTGAAVRDIINILQRRYPLCEIMLCPVSVQGERAVGDMLDALDRIYALGGVDTVIIGRGGGSAEDLWAFNSEELARKIYEAPMPVISAVGHETDFTICDFVADLRAPTPSAAAELAVPDCNELIQAVSNARLRLKRSLQARYELDVSRLERLMAAQMFTHPESIVEDREYRLDSAVMRLQNAVKGQGDSATNKFLQATARLEALNPLKVLTRGFAVAQKGEVAVKSSVQLKKGDKITLKLNDGSADCTVEDVRYDNP